MISKNVSRGVGGLTAVGSLAVGAVMVSVASLPQEQRVKFLKVLGMLFMVFLALLSAVASIGMFADILSPATHFHGDERVWGTAFATVLALPFAFVLFKGIKRLFRK